EERDAGRPIRGWIIGQESALAAGAGMRVDFPIDGLETERRHGHPVGAGVDEANHERRRLAQRAPLGREPRARLLLELIARRHLKLYTGSPSRTQTTQRIHARRTNPSTNRSSSRAAAGVSVVCSASAAARSAPMSGARRRQYSRDTAPVTSG